MLIRDVNIPVRLVCRSAGGSGVPGALLGGQLALCRETLQVTHEAQTQRVLDVESLYRHQVPRHLGCALSEPYVVVVHSELAGVVR